jgi:hypothetical protein
LQSIQAEAAVTGTLPTNDVYNNQNVVLIRPADGPVVETAFRSDDFNVYPPRNRTAPYGEWRSAAANAFLAQPAKEAPRFRTGVVNRQELPGRCGRLGRKTSTKSRVRQRPAGYWLAPGQQDAIDAPSRIALAGETVSAISKSWPSRSLLSSPRIEAARQRTATAAI